MKNFKRVSTLLSVCGVVLLLFAACSKSSNSKDNGNFTGTYAGTLSKGLYSEPDTIQIPASSTSEIVMNSKTGSGSTYAITGTVSDTTVTIASQSVYVPSLSATYTVTGTGTLSGSVLTINYVFVSSSSVSSAWTFYGIRQ